MSRYQVMAGESDQGELRPFGEADDLTGANKLIIAALQPGTGHGYACQHDTTPDVDRPMGGPMLRVDARANLVGECAPSAARAE